MNIAAFTQFSWFSRQPFFHFTRYCKTNPYKTKPKREQKMTVKAKVRNTFTPSIHLLTSLWDVPSKRFGITELLAWKFQKKNAVGDFGPSPESPVSRQMKMIQHKRMAGIHTRRHRNILGAHNYDKCIHTHTHINTHTHTHTHTHKNTHTPTHTLKKEKKKTLHTQMHAHHTHACTPLTHTHSCTHSSNRTRCQLLS